MSFPNDGINHHNGIKNENSTKEFLKEHAIQLFPELCDKNYVVESRGGTKYKADNVIINEDGNVINISDKQKKKGLGGSYDYTNTSAAINLLIQRDSKSMREINKVYNSVKKDRKLFLEQRKQKIDEYRLKIKEASYFALNNLTIDEIVLLLNKFFIEPNMEQVMFITDGKENKRYMFPFADHPVINLIKTGYTPKILVKSGKSSGFIKFYNDDFDVVDVKLRIRVHTNNGATALLNGGGSNTNSKFVLKFQQDGIKSLLNTMGVSAIAI